MTRCWCRITRLWPRRDEPNEQSKASERGVECVGMGCAYCLAEEEREEGDEVVCHGAVCEVPRSEGRVEEVGCTSNQADCLDVGDG